MGPAQQRVYPLQGTAFPQEAEDSAPSLPPGEQGVRLQPVVGNDLVAPGSCGSETRRLWSEPQRGKDGACRRPVVPYLHVCF